MVFISSKAFPGLFLGVSLATTNVSVKVIASSINACRDWTLQTCGIYYAMTPTTAPSLAVTQASDTVANLQPCKFLSSQAFKRIPASVSTDGGDYIYYVIQFILPSSTGKVFLATDGARVFFTNTPNDDRCMWKFQ